MDNDLIVLSGYDRAVGIFIDGAPNNCAALLLAERGYIRAASAKLTRRGALPLITIFFSFRFLPTGQRLFLHPSGTGNKPPEYRYQ